MPGNEQYPGARRRSPKKGPTKGSGGKRRRRLEGRGPTPKAEDRVGHPRARAKARAQARAAQPTHAKRLEQARARFGVPAGHEIVCGRNAVAEAARAAVPIARVFMAAAAASSESDDRLDAVVRRATLLGAPVLEATRLDLEALTDGAAHQGVAIEVPAYEYADAAGLLAALRLHQGPVLVLIDDAERIDDSDHALAELLAESPPNVRIAAAGWVDHLCTLYSHWTKTLRRSRCGILLQPNVDIDDDLVSARIPSICARYGT